MQPCISTYPLTLIRAFQDMLRNLEIVNAQFNRTLNISMTSSKNIHRNMTSVGNQPSFFQNARNMIISGGEYKYSVINKQIIHDPGLRSEIVSHDFCVPPFK